LDEVNLNGANGVLVNITSGPNFTMREFDEVGSIIEAFASEDATVVVGAVLDPNMGDEVRVTVVATGLNQARARAVKPPVLVKSPEHAIWEATGTDSPFPIESSSSQSIGLSGQLRRPARMEPTAVSTSSALSSFGGSSGESYLDIPSFLRRQAD
jgi:cell division protein FtsZ